MKKNETKYTILMMDNKTYFLLLPVLLICIHVFLDRFSGRKSSLRTRLPPGPYPLPIIGNIFKLGDKPHRSLAALSKIYGPLMSLKLGCTTTIVVSSPDMVKEFLHEHDQSFSSRSIPETSRVLDHHKFSLACSPVGDQWRMLRRICKEHMFSLQRLDASQLVRERKLQQLLNHVHQCCANGGKAVNIGEVAFTTTLNFLSSFIFSIDLAPYDSLSSQDFKDAVWALMEVAGKPNLSDFFPILKPLDLQGLQRQCKVYMEKLIAIFDKIINQRLETRSESSYDNSSMGKDVLDLLLDLIQKDESGFSLNDMRHLFLELFVAGTDTTSITVEWAMAELIHNPQKMEIARIELENIIQRENGIVRESDISNLPYLQAIVKETLRLHPPAPFLVPHKAIHDVEIQGFVVPKDAKILCNVWAIGQDSSIWSKPEMFLPERFLHNEIDYHGKDFELIPFGSGRRICPGLPLAYRMSHIMLGCLICKFNWKIEGEMDMNDKFGLTLRKSVPLLAIPTARNN